jgi:ketosteroid isomerase-like protein
MFIVLLPAASFAESTGDDQAAVWTAVERIWSAGERGDLDWVDSMLSADFMGWPMDSPAPRSKGSTRMWARFGADQGKGLAHELYPLSIVVHGDMAVVHYLYQLAVQDRDKRTVMSSGRFTDVLVRDGNDWKFISWHGGDDLASR